MDRQLRLVVALLGFAAVGATQFGVKPPPGAIKGVAEVLAFAPQSVRDTYADAGFAFTSSGRYVQFRVRAWYDPDSGTVGLPNMPEGLQVVRIRRAGQGCVDPILCADGGDRLDPVSEVAFDCACSSGAQCFTYVMDGGVYPDGGTRIMPAPQGVTLSVFGGPGCVPKSCVELFAYGGSSWPYDNCPCPGGDGGC